MCCRSWCCWWTFDVHINNPMSQLLCGSLFLTVPFREDNKTNRWKNHSAKKKNHPLPQGIPLRRKWARAAGWYPWCPWSPAPKMKPLWAQSCWMKACQPCCQSISCGEKRRREWTLGCCSGSYVSNYHDLKIHINQDSNTHENITCFHGPLTLNQPFPRPQPCPRSSSPQWGVVWAFHTLLKSAFKSTWGRNIQTQAHTQARQLIAQLLIFSPSSCTHVLSIGPQEQQQTAAVETDPTRPLKLVAIISTCDRKSTEGGCKQTAAVSRFLWISIIGLEAAKDSDSRSRERPQSRCGIQVKI